MKEKQMKTYLVCYGTPQPRCVVVGRSPTEPVIGEPVTLYDVRMILRWEGGGLHSRLADGPRQGDRITSAAPSYSVVVGEWGEVSESAAAAFREHPGC